MASKKKGQLTKYCRIFQWLQARDPDFAGAIRDLCLEALLNPSGRSPGVTFLYPKDKAYRDDIIEKAYSDDANEAAKHIESLIIPDALLQCSDFQRRPVGSRLGVKYAVESAGQGKVKLANGVELAAVEDFHTGEWREADIAIWYVVKGRLPLSGESYKPPPRERKAKGGAEGAPLVLLNNRQLAASKVEAAFDKTMREGKIHLDHPYLGKVVSLMNYLQHHSPDTFQTVLPILDYDPIVSYYLLLEPYKNPSSGPYLIPDSLVEGEGGWNNADAYGNAVEEYVALFTNLPNSQVTSATDLQTGDPVIPYVFRDQPYIATQVDLVRQQCEANPRNIQSIIEDAYALLGGQNTVGGVGPILPTSTKGAIAGSKKFWQDQFRFIVGMAIQRMYSGPYSTATFDKIIVDLRLAHPGNNYGSEVNLTDLMKASAVKTAAFMVASKFVRSTDFLYTPPSPNTIGANQASMDDPTDSNVLNRNAIAFSRLRKTGGMVRTDLTPKARQEIEHYVRTNGSLPPSVLALLPRGAH
jgi:hypothetical protein